MSNKVKKILIVVLILVAILSFGFVYYKLTHKSSPKIDEIKKEDEIQTKEFDYTLYDNKSDLYKRICSCICSYANIDLDCCIPIH